MTHKIFGAVWCGNCTSTKAYLDAQGIPHKYIDIDEYREIAVANNIRSLPTLITESGDRVVGLVKIKEYFSQNEHLPSN